MNVGDPWTIVEGEGPIVALAVHNGHEIREELEPFLVLEESSRLREEDPFTGEWTRVAGTRVIVNRSRFEVDLNRPREKAVYRRPGDSWGLRVWGKQLPKDLIRRSLEIYDTFYEELRCILNTVREREGRFLVYDIHSYCHRRNGPQADSGPAEENPEINLGTGTMEREFWAPVVERFIRDMGAYEFMGRKLDVRENVRFRGGNVPKWIHENYPGEACCLAIEVKKFFMDEWTGVPFPDLIAEVGKALESTVPGVLRALDEVRSPR
jgi:N-formylglutamate amidohydrolase